ncbi:hypothetical protein DIPPA_30137 [Diplonema papillatum]|nr:hypothetical protein DIPPA_30137 [Diplonema papillatum]
MSLVGEYGFPSYFITVNANGAWPELCDDLDPWEQRENNVTNIARVYERKRIEFIKDMAFCLGERLAYILATEFQMRGLPHFHLVQWNKPGHRATTPDEMDHVACAELPDPKKNPDLYDLVCQHMVHRSCLASRKHGTKIGGDVKPHTCSVKCKKTGNWVCSAGFPMAWKDKTEKTSTGSCVPQTPE